MHRGQHARPHEEGAEDREKEGQHRKQRRPGGKTFALLCDNNRVQQGRADQPRHQRGILNRVPEPPAAPAEFVIGPVGTERDPECQRRKRRERPAAGLPRPHAVYTPFHQAGCGKREHEGITDIAEIEHRRMDRERRVLEQRVEACALERRRVQPEIRRRGQQQVGERAGGQKSLHAERARLEQLAPRAHHGRRCGAEADRHQAPHRHGALMVSPGAGDLVDHRFQRVRVVGDQRDREIRGHEGVDDGQERQRHQPEGRHGEQARRPALSPQPEHTLRE